MWVRVWVRVWVWVRVLVWGAGVGMGVGAGVGVGCGCGCVHSERDVVDLTERMVLAFRGQTTQTQRSREMRRVRQLDTLRKPA